MNADSWERTDSQQQMIDWLLSGKGNLYRTKGGVPVGISKRKLRLIACACGWLHAQSYIEKFPDDQSVWAIVGAEAMADGAPSPMRMKDLTYGFYVVYPDEDRAARAMLGCTTQEDKADLVRCIVGNPFRHQEITIQCPECGGTGEVGPCGLTGYYRACHVCGDPRKRKNGTGRVNPPWIAPQALSLAQDAYENRIMPTRHLDPAKLMVLADCLEEAGIPGAPCPECGGKKTKTVRPSDFEWKSLPIGQTSAATILSAIGYGYNECQVPCHACGGNGLAPSLLLEHLRSPGPHWMGCWAVDMVLGRE